MDSSKVTGIPRSLGTWVCCLAFLSVRQKTFFSNHKNHPVKGCLTQEWEGNRIGGILSKLHLHPIILRSFCMWRIMTNSAT